MSDEPVVESEERGQGLPLWMPPLGLVVAFAVAIFIGVRIIPTLSAPRPIQ